MDFQNLNGVWKLKRFCTTCIELIFKFFFSVNSFFYHFDFQERKMHLNNLVLETLFLGDHSLTFDLCLLDDKF